MKKLFQNYRNQWMTFFAIVVFGGAFWLVDHALQSDLFVIQKLEVHSPNEKIVSAKAIEVLAAIPLGVARLIEVDLVQVEQNIKRHPWISQVDLQKVFPNSMKISVQFRKPIAVVQKNDESLEYVDHEGKRFGELSLDQGVDLPVLLGAMWKEEERLQEAVEFINEWNHERLNDFVELSSLRFDSERGVQGLTLYQIPKFNEPVRTLLDFGQLVGTSTFNRFQSLRQVYQYLIENTKIAKKVLILDNKKIVVRTDRRS